MTRKYPAYIIDKSKRSVESNNQFDYIVCTDKEAGFIAKVYKLQKSLYEDLRKKIDLLPIKDTKIKYSFYVLKDIAVVIEVVEWLYPITDKSRIKPLLKKAMNRYIDDSIAEVKGDGTPIDYQLAVVKDIRNMYNAQKEEVIKEMGEIATRRIIKSLDDTIISLESLKKMNEFF